jgi:virulence factor Mce-like protein
MRRRGSASIAANPVLIGAATTLIVIVAVFLAYNANSGLPFVPSYELKAEVPNAANLVKGNDVRVGGARVGAVTAIDPVQHDDGSVTALLTMKLETVVKPLPVNSTVLIRPRSALGLKYVEITKGTSSKGLQDGATIPLRQATPQPVELDEVLNTFDDRTRAASRTNLNELGTALAGRGGDLNQAIELANPLLLDLAPVMDNLSSRQTQLRRFNDSLARTAGLLAPVAETQASLFRNLDTTFTALASVARPYLQDSISGAPEALDAATTSFRAQRPFLANS